MMVEMMELIGMTIFTATWITGLGYLTYLITSTAVRWYGDWHADHTGGR